MTPAEFLCAVQAFQRRQDAEMYRTAWMVSYLLQPHLKKGRRLTPEKLLGKAQDRARAARDAETRDARTDDE